MDDTKKMLQAIISGQNALKQELVVKIDKWGEKLDGRIDGLEGRIDTLEERVVKVGNNLTKRIDKIGKQLAYLEDDSPTREEYDELEKRVHKIEQKVISV